MARLSTGGANTPDVTAINLTRLLSRLQKILLQPEATTEQRLRTSSYERSRVNANLDYARTLLLRLEQDAAGIKIQSKKQEAQIELLQKRDVILQLSERLEELDHFGHDTEEDTSDGEDLLGEDTPSDDFEGNETPSEAAIEEDPMPTAAAAPPLNSPTAVPPPSPPAPSSRDQLFPPSLRSRHAQNPPSLGQDTGATTSSDAAATTLTEKMLSHNRTEQESLTDSLLSMAQALKASSQAFSNSLESEKDTLGRATEGLDKNTSGLEAASKRMGYLRRMTEGKGWLGRMMMYAWIFGLMFVALFIVGFLPKLRF